MGGLLDIQGLLRLMVHLYVLREAVRVYYMSIFMYIKVCSWSSIPCKIVCTYIIQKIKAAGSPASHLQPRLCHACLIDVLEFGFKCTSCVLLFHRCVPFERRHKNICHL